MACPFALQASGRAIRFGSYISFRSPAAIPHAKGCKQAAPLQTTTKYNKLLRFKKTKAIALKNKG
jgi:hypothetical protein